MFLHSIFRYNFHVKYSTLYFTIAKVWAVCRNLQLAWATFVCPNGAFAPNPKQAKKTVSCLFCSCFFRKWHKLKKAPPAISLRAFHAEALPCLSAGLPTRKEKLLDSKKYQPPINLKMVLTMN